MREEKIVFEASGHYIFAENICLTLKSLLKLIQGYRDNVPFDFVIKIIEREEIK